MILSSRLGALVALLLVLVALVPAHPDGADALPVAPDLLNPCDLPGLGQACDAVRAGVGALADIPGEIAKGVGSGILAELTRWVGDGAGWLARQVIGGLDVSTRVDLGGPWFRAHYRWMVALGGFLLLPFLVLAILQGLVRQDWTLLLRAALGYLPAAVLLTALAVAVTQAVLAATDALSADLAQGVARDGGRLGPAFTSAFLSSGSQVPLFVGFLVGLVMALGAFLVWLELLVRSGAIYLAVLFLPFCLAAMVWPASARWARRLVEVLIALVLAKLVVVAALALGLGAIASGRSVATVLAGAGMFMVAAFVPFALLSLIPLAGEIAHPQREARAGIATATGGAIAWQVARAHLVRAAGGAGRALPFAGAGGAPSGPGPGASLRPAGVMGQPTTGPVSGTKRRRGPATAETEGPGDA